MPGPVPKRSSQRRRRNKPDGPPPKGGAGATTEAWVEYAESLGLDVPEGSGRAEVQELVAAYGRDEGWHPLAAEWFESLSQSGQSAFYEPSDWATARVAAELLSRALRQDRLSAALIERWQSAATELLTTEGARRRVRIELDVAAAGDGGLDEEAQSSVSDLDEFRRRQQSS